MSFSSRPRNANVNAFTVISAKANGLTTKSVPPQRADWARNCSSEWLVTNTTGVERLAGVTLIVTL